MRVRRSEGRKLAGTFLDHAAVVVVGNENSGGST